MRLEYDPRGDIAYIHVGPTANAAVHHIERVGDSEEYRRGIDYDASGAIAGYEFMDASAGVDLGGLPHRDDIEALIRSVAGLRVSSRAS